MLLRIVVEAEAQDPQAAKEDLAMALERYAPAKVVEVAPVYRQEVTKQTGDGSLSADRQRTVPRLTETGGKNLSAPHLHQRERQDGILEGIPTDGVVGPFARADAAFRAAVEANMEKRSE